MLSCCSRLFLNLLNSFFSSILPLSPRHLLVVCILVFRAKLKRMMFKLLAWRNLKIVVWMHERIQLSFKPEQNRGMFRSYSEIGFEFLVFCQFMLDYAPIAPFEKWCCRRWIMPSLFFETAGMNLCLLVYL